MSSSRALRTAFFTAFFTSLSTDAQ
jgi:hypothetical protein